MGSTHSPLILCFHPCPPRKLRHYRMFLTPPWRNKSYKLWIIKLENILQTFCLCLQSTIIIGEKKKINLHMNHQINNLYYWQNQINYEPLTGKNLNFHWWLTSFQLQIILKISSKLFLYKILLPLPNIDLQINSGFR